MVTTSQPCRSIRRRHERFDLWPREKTHQGTWLSLVGNGQHALYDSALRRCLQRGISEELPDGRQTQIAAPGSIAPTPFQVFQKCADQGAIQIVQLQLRGRLAQPRLRELKQQAKG